MVEIKDSHIIEIDFGKMNGAAFIRDLKRNMRLWEAIIISSMDNEIILTNLQNWNVDNIYIVALEKEEELLRLVNSWNVNKITWLKRKDAKKILANSYLRDRDKVLRLF